jgi:hypothetical protein
MWYACFFYFKIKKCFVCQDKATSLIGCLIIIVGEDVPISELADSIYAAQTAEKENEFCDASNSDEVFIHPPIVIGSIVLCCFFFFLLL